MRALIDADILCYRVGFASQHKLYHVDVDGLEMVVRSKKEATALEGIIVDTSVDAMPESFVEKLLLNTIDTIVADVKADSYNLYLTDSASNFRNEVAVTHKYKGTRSGDKPHHFDYIKDYLINKLNAELIYGQEADDALAIAQTDDTVICTIDKDLLMVPGKHYNIAERTKVIARDPGKIKLKDNGKLTGGGFKWFCAQMLLGDTVDNIKCVKGIGDKRALKILDKCTTVRKMWSRIRAVYRIHKMLDRLEENAILLWMRREKEQHPFTWIKDNS